MSEQKLADYHKVIGKGDKIGITTWQRSDDCGTWEIRPTKDALTMELWHIVPEAEPGTGATLGRHPRRS